MYVSMGRVFVWVVVRPGHGDAGSDTGSSVGRQDPGEGAPRTSTRRLWSYNPSTVEGLLWCLHDRRPRGAIVTTSFDRVVLAPDLGVLGSGELWGHSNPLGKGSGRSSFLGSGQL